MIVKANNPSRKTLKRKAEGDAQGSPSHSSRVTAFAAPESAQAQASQTPAKTRAPRGLHSSPALPEGGDTSILYPSAMEAYRKIRHNQPQRAATPSPFETRGDAPGSTMAPVLPSVSSASKSRWQEHQKRLRQVSAMMNPGGIRKQKSSSSASALPSWRKNVLNRIVGVMRTNALQENDASTAFQDPDVIGEFDRDVSEAMVTFGGRFVGLDPQELMHSQGLRKLVARNIRWFQNTPDWLKLVGLVVAKRLNSAVRSTTMQQNNNSREETEYNHHHRIEGLDDLPVTLPPCSPLPMSALLDEEDVVVVAPAVPVREDERDDTPAPPTKKAAKAKGKGHKNTAAQESNPPPNPSEDIPDSSFF